MFCIELGLVVIKKDSLLDEQITLPNTALLVPSQARDVGIGDDSP